MEGMTLSVKPASEGLKNGVENIVANAVAGRNSSVRKDIVVTESLLRCDILASRC